MTSLRPLSTVLMTLVLAACGDDVGAGGVGAGGAGAGGPGAGGAGTTSSSDGGSTGSTSSTCANGVQDADEQGVDCGGACEACPYAPCDGWGATCPAGQVCLRTLCEDTFDCAWSCHPEVDGPCTTESCGPAQHCVRSSSGDDSAYGCALRGELGAFCERDRHCAEGSFCTKANQCAAVLAAGAVCTDLLWVPGGQYVCVEGYTCQPGAFLGDDSLCKPALQQGEPCSGTNSGCAKGLFCDTSLTSGQWVCSPVRAAGQACPVFGYACEEYYFCDDVCVEQG